MPISYRIDRDLNLLTVVGTGPVTDEDLAEYKGKLTADPDLAYVTREISDFRAANIAVSPKRIPEVARLHEEVFAGGQATRCAVLVASDLLYGLVRMYAQCIGRGDHEVAPFRTVEEARAWLDLPAEECEGGD